MERSFENNSDLHPNSKIKFKSPITSTPKLKRNSPETIREECELLKLSTSDLERVDAISDLHYVGEGNQGQRIQEHGKQSSQLSESIQSGKRKKKRVKNNESTITHFLDAAHSSNNNFGTLLRDKSMSKSELRGMHFGVKALNSPLKGMKAKADKGRKRRKRSTSKRRREPDLSKSFTEGEMYSISLVHDIEGGIKSPKMKEIDTEDPVSIHFAMEDSETCVANTYSEASLNELCDSKRRQKGKRKKKSKNHSSVDKLSDISPINVCAEQDRQLRACNDELNDEAMKKSVNKQKNKKPKKSLVCECPDMSDNNTCTEEEVHPEVSKDEAGKNEGRNQKMKHLKIKASKKKKKPYMFPVDGSSLCGTSYCVEDCIPKHSRTSEDIECDPKIRKKSNTHPGTPIEDHKKKKKKKRKVKGQHKESSSDLTVDLSENDTDYCSCSVNASSPSLVKQSTSSDKRSLEEDLFEFPSSNDSFHLDLNSDSSRNSVQVAEMKSSFSKSPNKHMSVDRNGVDYETLLQDALMNKNYLTDHEILKMKNLEIVCHHEVYPLHCADLLPCKPPSKQDMEILSNYKVKSGRFTEEENEILQRNWKMFCKEYNFEDPEPFINFENNYLKIEKRRDFLQYLGKDLPDRPLYMIFKHFIYLSQHQNKGVFTEEEDAFILKTKRRNIAQPYSVLSRILKRNRQSIYKRFKMLEQSCNAEECSNSKNQGNRSFSEKREKWSKSLAESIVKSLAEVMNVSSIEDLKDVKIPNGIWQKVGEQIKVPDHKLRQFWNYRLHVQLFAESPLRESEIYQHIISWLHHKNPSSMKDISWKDLIHLVPGSTDWFMWEMFRRLRKRYHADMYSNLQDFIRSLYTRDVKMKDAFIPRYKVGEDFSLSYIS